MMRSWRAVILFPIGLLLFLQACASTGITRRELSSIESIQVARYKTPDLEVKTVAGVILIFSGGLLTAPLGASIDERASKRANQSVIFPDYGDLLVRSFLRVAPKELPGWPKMTAVNKPVDRGYKYAGAALLVFDVDHLWLTKFGGLTIEGDVIMRDPNGNTLFKRHFWYRSRDFGLLKDQDEYLANNAKLLVDEIPLAAEHTARTLIIGPLKEGL